jgi:hypothetical protein
MSTLASVRDGSLGAAYQDGSLGGAVVRSGSLGGCGCGSDAAPTSAPNTSPMWSALKYVLILGGGAFLLTKVLKKA